VPVISWRALLILVSFYPEVKITFFPS